MISPTKTILPGTTNPLDRDSDRPMTEIQAARLRELSEELGEPFDGNLTERQAQKRIAALEEMKAA